MAAPGIELYCGVLQQGGDITGSDTMSSIQGQWGRTATLWNDGVNKYIFWGDTTGEVTIFDLELEPAGDCDNVDAAVADYSTATTVTIKQGVAGAINTVLTFTSCAYDFGIANKQLKQIGDVFVVEGGTNFKIFKSA